MFLCVCVRLTARPACIWRKAFAKASSLCTIRFMASFKSSKIEIAEAFRRGQKWCFSKYSTLTMGYYITPFNILFGFLRPSIFWVGSTDHRVVHLKLSSGGMAAQSLCVTRLSATSSLTNTKENHQTGFPIHKDPILSPKKSPINLRQMALIEAP